MTITIRTLHTPAEMNEVVQLQKVYWGNNMADIVPTHMLLSIARYGGHVHAAIDTDANDKTEKMVGVLMGFLGAEISPHNDTVAAHQLYVMSKRMVVLPEYRGQRIGEHLKQAQRQFAIQHRIPCVLWTFDPLLSRNAYLNLHKLGAVIQHYEEDYFGSAADNPVLSADRVQVNWWVNHPSLDNRPTHNVAQLPVVNQVSLTSEGLFEPQSLTIPSGAPALRLELPIEFVPLERLEPDLGSHWRTHIREAFTQLLAQGYIATDFARIENRVFYIFTPDDGTYNYPQTNG